MRFLLHPTRIAPTAIRRPRCLPTTNRITVDPSKMAAAATVKAAGDDATTNSTKPSTQQQQHKWGQHHCGTSCSCVLRLDVTIDSADGGVVTAARYTAKSILRSHHQHHDDNTTGPRPYYVSPRLAAAQNAARHAKDTTNDTTKQQQNHKLFLTECTCPNLHRLAQKTCAYMLHKNAFQIMNNCLYTSPPMKRYISRTHRGLAQSPHCYDLVHATLQALWQQRPPPVPAQAMATRNDDAISFSFEPTTAAATTSYFDDTTALTTAPEQRSTSSSSSWWTNRPWWWWTTTPSNNGQYDDDYDNGGSSYAQGSSGSGNNADHYLPETLQQHLDRMDAVLNAADDDDRRPTSSATTTTSPSLLSASHQDWLAYVDEMQDDERHDQTTDYSWSKSA
jgi:hypothetical protein